MLEARTVYALAVLSLLSSRIVATAPTELEEISKRAALLANGQELGRDPDAFLWMKDYSVFASSASDLESAREAFANQYNEAKVDCQQTFEALKSNPDFRLDRIAKQLYTEQPLPF